MWNWSHAIISGDILQHLNPDASLLIEKTLKSGKAHLGKSGALLVSTGPPASKMIVVEDDQTVDVIDWNKKAQAIDPDAFEYLVQQYLKKIHLMKPELYLLEASVCADVSQSLGLHLITPSPVHAFFMQTLFREKRNFCPLGDFTVYHDPEGEKATVALNFSTKEILITGTSSFADIELSISAAISTLLVDRGTLFLRGRLVKDIGKLSFYLSSNFSYCSYGLSPEGLFLINAGYYRRSIESARFGCIEENREFLVCKETGIDETYPFPDEIVSYSSDIFASDKSLLRNQLEYMELMKVLLEKTRSSYVVSHKEDSHLHRPH